MIEVINYTNKNVQEALVPTISRAYDETKTLVHDLPETLRLYFMDEGIVPESGIGGSAYDHETMNISFDAEFAHKELQLSELRATIFHEAFHIKQKFTFQSFPNSALEAAIYEGCATVFEREYGQGIAPYGKYDDNTDETLNGWLSSVKAIGHTYFEDDAIWHKWAFYNPDTKERWIIYKLGTWLVDQTLQKHKLTILELQDKTAVEIIALAEV